MHSKHKWTHPLKVTFFSICFRNGKSHLATFREHTFNRVMFTSNTAAREIQTPMFISSFKIKILHKIPFLLQQYLLYSFFVILTVFIFVDWYSLIHFNSLVADLSLKKNQKNKNTLKTNQTQNNKKSIFPMTNSNLCWLHLWLPPEPTAFFK